MYDSHDLRLRVTVAVLDAYVRSRYLDEPDKGKGYEYVAAIDRVRAHGPEALSYEDKELLTELTREVMTFASGMII